jgi:hypothetical protein
VDAEPAVYASVKEPLPPPGVAAGGVQLVEAEDGSTAWQYHHTGPPSHTAQRVSGESLVRCNWRNVSIQYSTWAKRESTQKTAHVAQ